MDITPRPTILSRQIPTPYELFGGLVVPIAIDCQDKRAGQPGDTPVNPAPLPALSTSFAPGTPLGNTSPSQDAVFSSMLSPAQRAMLQRLEEPPAGYAMPAPALTLPSLRMEGWSDGMPLSLQAAAPMASDAPVLAPDAPGPEVKPDAGHATTDTAKPAEKKEDPTLKSLLLGKTPQSWTLAESKDFQNGTHIGTAVTSKGRLVLAPAVRARASITGMLPWRAVATPDGVFVAGWESPTLWRVPADGQASTLTPNLPIDSITALAADPEGNLLIAGTPGNLVALLTPRGKELHRWTLPPGITWDLAVTRDGRRYAAESTGQLLLLPDDAAPAVAFTAPDRQLYALAVAGATLYLGTAPHGKVFRLAKDGTVSAIYEVKDSVSSLAADTAGNVYIGTSPACDVIRVAPDGSHLVIALGLGKNVPQHVMALAPAGDDLYAATGSSGGIYRIQGLAANDPEVTMIYAREDMRRSVAEANTLGCESVMVNGLAVTTAGEVYAAASGPGQVLQLIPRAEGDFLSPVIPAPATATWGRIEVRTARAASPATLLETRSGNLAMPDGVWSNWAAVKAGNYIASPPAAYAQLHLHLAAADAAVEYVRAQYLPPNQPPTLKVTAPVNGAILSGKKDFTWEGKDADGGKLVYTVQYSADGKAWTPLNLTPPVDKPAAEPANKPADKPAEKPADDASNKPADKPAKPMFETNEAKVTVDTTRIPDGVWFLKVTASQKYAKPANPLDVSVVCGPVTVDNTPPTVSLPDKVASWAQVQEFLITDNLTPIAGGKFRLDDGPWIEFTPADGLFDSVSKHVKLLCPDGAPTLEPGDHTLELAIVDSADNWLLKKVTIAIAGK